MGVTGTVQRVASPTRIASAIPSDIEAMAYGLLGTPDEVRAELDRIQSHVNDLYKMEPDMALRVIAAYSARVTEIMRLLFRVEIHDRTYVRLRTMDGQPLLEELSLQFKIHSRMLEARAQDIALEGVRR